MKLVNILMVVALTAAGIAVANSVLPGGEVSKWARAAEHFAAYGRDRLFGDNEATCVHLEPAGLTWEPYATLLQRRGSYADRYREITGGEELSDFRAWHFENSKMTQGFDRDVQIWLDNVQSILDLDPRDPEARAKLLREGSREVARDALVTAFDQVEIAVVWDSWIRRRHCPDRKGQRETVLQAIEAYEKNYAMALRLAGLTGATTGD